MPATGPRSERLRGEVFLPSVFLEAGVKVVLFASQCISEQMIIGETHHPNPPPHAQKQKESWEHPYGHSGKKKKREKKNDQGELWK